MGGVLSKIRKKFGRHVELVKELVSACPTGKISLENLDATTELKELLQKYPGVKNGKNSNRLTYAYSLLYELAIISVALKREQELQKFSPGNPEILISQDKKGELFRRKEQIQELLKHFGYDKPKLEI